MNHAQGQIVHGRKRRQGFPFKPPGDVQPVGERSGIAQGTRLLAQEPSARGANQSSSLTLLPTRPMSTTTVCVCCGEPFPKGSLSASPNPNVCAACYDSPDETIESACCGRGCLSYGNASLPFRDENSLRHNFPRAIPTGKTPGAGLRVNGGAAGAKGADDLDAQTSELQWSIRFARTIPTPMR
jgi:hypothetical protein